jgi:hypothetical protein
VPELGGSLGSEVCGRRRVLLALHCDGRWREGCPSATGPDQDVALLIDRQALARDEFVLHILQGRVVELELPLEGAVGHPAPLAQQGDHLVYHRDKVHPLSSLPGAGPVCPCIPS